MAKRVLLFGDSPEVSLDEVDSQVDDIDIGGLTITSALGVDLGGFKATNSAPPTNDGDLANKQYVDANSGGGFDVCTIVTDEDFDVVVGEDHCVLLSEP